MKIKAIIVDDEENARKALLNMLEFYCQDIEIAGIAENITAAFDLIQKTTPELVFLDIQMPDGNGFELLKKFKKIPFKVIFVTAFDQFALRAIKLSAVDYLLKPVSPRDLIKSTNKVMDELAKEERLAQKLEALEENMDTSQQAKKIILNTSTNMHVLKLEDIIRCEADENYTRVMTNDGKVVMVAKTIKEFDEMLTPYGFCRIHQSHLINLNHVITYEKGSSGMVVLSSNEKVPVSGRRKEFFLSALQGNL